MTLTTAQRLTLIVTLLIVVGILIKYSPHTTEVETSRNKFETQPIIPEWTQ